MVGVVVVVVFIEIVIAVVDRPGLGLGLDTWWFVFVVATVRQRQFWLMRGTRYFVGLRMAFRILLVVTRRKPFGCPSPTGLYVVSRRCLVKTEMLAEVESVIVATKVSGDEAIADHCGNWTSAAMLPRGFG